MFLSLLFKTKTTIKFYKNKIKITLILLFLFFITSNLYAIEKAKLTILHTNDIHSHILPFDESLVGKNVGGLARHYEFVNKIRNEVGTDNVLLLDAGDLFQGTPFYTFFKGEIEFKILSLIGYDAITLGNHDLDDGLSNLLNQLKHANFPLLCANVFYKNNNQLVFEPYKIVNRANLKIALIGAIGKSAWNVIPKKFLSEIYMTDEHETVYNLSKKLRTDVDLIILLSHLGYNPDLKFAENSFNIDVIVGGHSNTTLVRPVLIKNDSNNGIGGTLILQGYKWGIYIGQLDLEFNKESKKIVSYDGKLHLINDKIKVNESSEVSMLIKEYEQKINEKINQIIGESLVEMKYLEDEKHKKVLPLGILCCDALKNNSNADFVIINSGTIRDMLHAGDITISNVMKILPFDNTIVTLNLTGKDVYEIFDFIASKYGTITGYQFDSGVSFTLNLKNKKAEDIFINNKPLDLNKTYKVATISYLIEGNQNGNILFKNAKNIVDNGYYMRDALIEYIKLNSPIKEINVNVMKIIE